MLEHRKRKFRILHETNDGRWHFGIFFCIDYDWSSSGKRDKYLLIAFGKHDIFIGMLTRYDEWEDTSYE